MLQTKTIRKDTFALLKQLCAFEILQHFNLAGGTALALQLGHRTSTDLDFFGKPITNLDLIKTEIQATYDYKIEVSSQNILIGFIDGIKVDFVRYKYDLLESPIIEQEIRLLSIIDIGCMKLAAITGRGKKRDFYDLYFILQRFSLSELLDFYQTKYYDSSLQLVLKSITYFEDAESDEDPNLFETRSWKDVKKTITNSFMDYYNRL